MALVKQTQKQRIVGAAVREELTRAEGANGSDLARVREKAWDYYMGRPRGDELSGRSQVISRDVADMVNAVTAQLTPMLTVDASVTFKANGAQDAESAAAESQAVSEVIYEHNDGFLAVQDALRDALLLRNGAIYIGVEERTETQTIDLPDEMGDLEVAMLLQPGQPEEEREVTNDGTAIKITRTLKDFVFRAVPIESMMWRANWPSRDLDQIPFIAEVTYFTRSDLVEMGISKNVVDKLPAADAPNAEQRGADRDTQAAFVAATRDQDAIMCHWAFILLDSDGDGISERHRVLLAGEDTVLMDEVVGWVPYAIGSAFVTAHRLTGESLYDHIGPIQDSKTSVLRQWYDNLVLANFPRVVFNPQETNVEDVLNHDAHSPIRSRNPGNVALNAFPDTGASNLAALEYLDRRRTEAGGAALDQLGANLQIAGETAHGVERQYAAKELLVAMFAANLAETLMRRAFILMHRTLRAEAVEPIEMEVVDQWVAIHPREWPERKRAKVTAGMSIGQRAHIQTMLANAVSLHMQAQQSGKQGILSDDQTLHRTITRWMQLAGIEDPDSFWVDPSSEAAQQAAQAMQQSQQAQMQEQMQAQQEAFVAQLQLARDQIAADLQKHRDEIEFKYADARLKAETAEAKIVGEATLQLERQQNDFANREASRGAGGGAARDGGTTQ